MVIASNFESRSFTSLFLTFGRQFVMFVIGILVASGIMYGIEHDYSSIWGNNENVVTSFTNRVEEFLNTTANSAVKDFVNTHNMDEHTVKDFIHLIGKLASFGVNTTTADEDEYWYNYHSQGMTFLQSFSLIISTITTVGWGHVVPITTGGKAFTCVVAALGIPLTFIMIVSGSHILIKTSKLLIHKMFGATRINFLYKPLIAVLLFIYILGTSAIIAAIEYFDYADAVWYTIMSLTTVGFGDVAQDSMMHHGRESSVIGVAIFQLLWLVVGFALIGGLVLGIVYDNWGDGRNTQFHQIFRNKDEELVDPDENED